MDKKEVLKEILNFLKANPKTQVANIRQHIENILESRGLVGEKIVSKQFSRIVSYVPITHEDAMLINEVIWDLIAKRIITPGINRDNLEWPWLSVTNMDKLKKMS